MGATFPGEVDHKQSDCLLALFLLFFFFFSVTVAKSWCRLDGKRMLEMLRGKRVAFVGDSLNRNMWESLVCILRQSLEDKDRVFEVSGRRDFKADGFYAFTFSVS